MTLGSICQVAGEAQGTTLRDVIRRRTPNTKRRVIIIYSSRLLQRAQHRMGAVLAAWATALPPPS
jgi:hypothetical protein